MYGERKNKRDAQIIAAWRSKLVHGKKRGHVRAFEIGPSSLGNDFPQTAIELKREFITT
jgi:hypothetical protein